MEGFTHLPHRLRNVGLVAGCCADLRLAAASIEALVELRASPRNKDRPSRAATEFALLATAIHLYARATEIQAEGAERGASKISANLTPQQRIDHDELIAARHHGLTHITYNETVLGGEVWNEARPIIVEEHQRWRVGFPTRMVQFRPATFEAITRQLPVALNVLEARFQRRLNAFLQALEQAPGWSRIVAAHGVDPADVFGSQAATTAATEPLETGELWTAYYVDEPR